MIDAQGAPQRVLRHRPLQLLNLTCGEGCARECAPALAAL